MGYFNDIKAFAYQYLLGKVSTYYEIVDPDLKLNVSISIR